MWNRMLRKSRYRCPSVHGNGQLKDRRLVRRFAYYECITGAPALLRGLLYRRTDPARGNPS
jgi:hypothetical protein